MILAPWRLRGLHLLFSTRPNEASHTRIKAESFPVSAEVHTQAVFVEVRWNFHPPPREEVKAKKEPVPSIVYIIF